jgi:microcystin-dependent protein
MPTNTPRLSLPYPTPDETVDVPRDIAALASAVDALGVVPVGAMAMWPTATPPAGWLPCLGQTNISAATYPALATVLGSSGGFILMPDFRDRFPVGAGPTMPISGAGSTGGASTVTLSAAQIPAHSHAIANVKAKVADPTHNHTGPAGYLAQAPNPYDNGSPSGTANNTGGGGSHENRPPYRAVTMIIRAV